METKWLFYKEGRLGRARSDNILTTRDELRPELRASTKPSQLSSFQWSFITEAPSAKEKGFISFTTKKHAWNEPQWSKALRWVKSHSFQGVLNAPLETSFGFVETPTTQCNTNNAAALAQNSTWANLHASLQILYGHNSCDRKEKTHSFFSSWSILGYTSFPRCKETCLVLVFVQNR